MIANLTRLREKGSIGPQLATVLVREILQVLREPTASRRERGGGGGGEGGGEGEGGGGEGGPMRA